MKQTIFEKIGQVKELFDTAEVNNYLLDGWVLLNVTSTNNPDSGAYKHCYSLGEIDIDRIDYE